MCSPPRDLGATADAARRDGDDDTFHLGPEDVLGRARWDPDSCWKPARLSSSGCIRRRFWSLSKRRACTRQDLGPSAQGRFRLDGGAQGWGFSGAGGSVDITMRKAEETCTSARKSNGTHASGWPPKSFRRAAAGEPKPITSRLASPHGRLEAPKTTRGVRAWPSREQVIVRQNNLFLLYESSAARRRTTIWFICIAVGGAGLSHRQ